MPGALDSRSVPLSSSAIPTSIRAPPPRTGRPRRPLPSAPAVPERHAAAAERRLPQRRPTGTGRFHVLGCRPNPATARRCHRSVTSPAACVAGNSARCRPPGGSPDSPSGAGSPSPPAEAPWPCSSDLSPMSALSQVDLTRHSCGLSGGAQRRDRWGSQMTNFSTTKEKRSACSGVGRSATGMAHI